MFAIACVFYVAGIGFFLVALSNILNALKRGCYPPRRILLERAAGMSGIALAIILIGCLFQLFR